MIFVLKDSLRGLQNAFVCRYAVRRSVYETIAPMCYDTRDSRPIRPLDKASGLAAHGMGPSARADVLRTLNHRVRRQVRVPSVAAFCSALERKPLHGGTAVVEMSACADQSSRSTIWSMLWNWPLRSARRTCRRRPPVARRWPTCRTRAATKVQASFYGDVGEALRKPLAGQGARGTAPFSPAPPPAAP
jgi:hypothetical protein